jgi:DNA-binding transcriptional LysR family regulator
LSSACRFFGDEWDQTSLRRLEVSIDGALFERTTKGLKLTVRGSKLLEDSKVAVEKWALLSKPEDAANGRVQLRVGMHPSVATYFAGDFLRAARKTYPSLGLELIHALSREIMRLVIDGELEAATVMNPVRSPGLVIRELLTDSVCLVGTRQGIDSNHLVYDPALAQSQWLLKAINKKGLKFTSETHSGNLEVIRGIAEAGLAVAILPTRVAALSKNKLVQVLQDGPTFRDRLCFICRPAFLRSNFGREVLNAAKAAAALHA